MCSARGGVLGWGTGYPPYGCVCRVRGEVEGIGGGWVRKCEKHKKCAHMGAFLENWGQGGLRLEAQTGTEGSTNTENTPYGVFSVLEGERQGLGIV